VRDQAAEASIAGIAQKVGLAGSGSAIVIGGLGLSDIAAIAGIVVGVIGLAVQVYFKRKQDRRERLFHDARMAGFKLPGDPE
jgi:biopolymer transport protein ExbB/TolQ